MRREAAKTLGCSTETQLKPSWTKREFRSLHAWSSSKNSRKHSSFVDLGELESGACCCQEFLYFSTLLGLSSRISFFHTPQRLVPGSPQFLLTLGLKNQALLLQLQLNSPEANSEHPVLGHNPHHWSSHVGQASCVLGLC